MDVCVLGCAWGVCPGVQKIGLMAVTAVPFVGTAAFCLDEVNPHITCDHTSVLGFTAVPCEIRLLLRQHSTLEISPLITIITHWLVQRGLVTLQ